MYTAVIFLDKIHSQTFSHLCQNRCTKFPNTSICMGDKITFSSVPNIVIMLHILAFLNVEFQIILNESIDLLVSICHQALDSKSLSLCQIRHTSLEPNELASIAVASFVTLQIQMKNMVGMNENNYQHL